MKKTLKVGQKIDVKIFGDRFDEDVAVNSWQHIIVRPFCTVEELTETHIKVRMTYAYFSRPLDDFGERVVKVFERIQYFWRASWEPIMLSGSIERAKELLR